MCQYAKVYWRIVLFRITQIYVKNILKLIYCIVFPLLFDISLIFIFKCFQSFLFLFCSYVKICHCFEYTHVQANMKSELYSSHFQANVKLWHV